MAKTSLKVKAARKPKFGVRAYTRCNRCGRPHSVYRKFGLSRTLIANMIVGVTEGYKKDLEITGTGYRVVAKGKDLEFSLGFSHTITVTPPEGIEFTIAPKSQTLFTVSGIDKQLVGETAARIRKLKKPEPYKGKGIHYVGETIRRKVGKAGK